MYSVVMAAMLTASAGSATTGWCHGCHGIVGCHGYAYCHGSCGGGWGYCHGWSGGYGCWGSYCSGCSGCYGCGGCYGCYGGVAYQPAMVCGGCCGCGGGVIYSAPPVAPLPAPMSPPPAGAAPMTGLYFAPPRNVAFRSATEGAKAQPARITVKLPGTARLWVDNVNCPITSTVRSFNTPTLTPGQQYYYTLRIEVDKDGQTVTENRRVYVAAGQQVNVDFNVPATVARR